MVEQLRENAIGLFDSLHPGCTAVFLFDNSSNHGAYSDDALVASRMTLNEKPWPLTMQYQFRDTVAVKTNKETMDQTFFYDKDVQWVDKKGYTKTKKVRYFKGIKKILQERDQWYYDMNGKPWKLSCGSNQALAPFMCCAKHFLESRSDFKSQKTALQETVENAGHIFELYPKYHCECN